MASLARGRLPLRVTEHLRISRRTVMTATTGRVWPLIRQRIDRFGIRDFSLPSLTGLTRYAYSRVHAPTRLPLYYNFSAPMIIQRISADLTIDSISRRFSPANSQKITVSYLSINCYSITVIQRRLFNDYNSSRTFVNTLLYTETRYFGILLALRSGC